MYGERNSVECGKAFALPVGEVLDAGEQGAADPVERVILVTASLQRLLLDATTDFVERVAGELDYVERVEHRYSVGQLVADRVGVATEWVQGGMLDGPRHIHALLGQPVGVDFA